MNSTTLNHTLCAYPDEVKIAVSQRAVDLVQIQGNRVAGVFDADDVLGGDGWLFVYSWSVQVAFAFYLAAADAVGFVPV